MCQSLHLAVNACINYIYICSFIAVWTILVIVVYNLVPVSMRFYWFRCLVYSFDNLHYVSHLHHVCTISVILYFFVPFVEVEYTLTIVNHLQPCSLHMRRNSIISSSDLKSVVTVIFSDISFLLLAPKFW